MFDGRDFKNQLQVSEKKKSSLNALNLKSSKAFLRLTFMVFSNRFLLYLVGICNFLNSSNSFNEKTLRPTHGFNY